MRSRSQLNSRCGMPLSGLLLVVLGGTAHAQSNEDLAKQLANPISSLISLPFQFNYDDGYGTTDATRFTLNIQPVIPIDLNEDWNLISRTIMPLISQDGFTPLRDGDTGLGDTVQSVFFSPKEPGPGGMIWGAGPVFLVPTAWQSTLGSEKFGAGPTGVALMQNGPWTYGALVNHMWSIFGADDRSGISATFMQPFLTYTTPYATSFFLNTESTYDWKGDTWSVPVNFGVNQLVTVGDQRMQFGGGLRYWLEAPDGGPDHWGLRFNFVLLFPTG